jgi:hypothetical protein
VKTGWTGQRRTYFGNPWGGVSFRLGCGGGNINRVYRGKRSNTLLLRLPLFIFPPPHPSLLRSRRDRNGPRVDFLECVCTFWSVQAYWVRPVRNILSSQDVVHKVLTRWRGAEDARRKRDRG